MKFVVSPLHLISGSPPPHPAPPHSASFFFLGAHGLLLLFFLTLCCFPGLIFPPLIPLHPLGPWWRPGTPDHSEPAGWGRQDGGRENRLGSRLSINICTWKTQVGDGEGWAPSVEACILPKVLQGPESWAGQEQAPRSETRMAGWGRVSTQKESLLLA